MKDLKLTEKVAKVLVKIGETQASACSTLLGFYEPEIPLDIIEKKK